MGTGKRSMLLHVVHMLAKMKPRGGGEKSSLKDHVKATKVKQKLPITTTWGIALFAKKNCHALAPKCIMGHLRQVHKQLGPLGG